MAKTVNRRTALIGAAAATLATPAQAPEHIAILRIDTDFYSSYHHILNALWDRVSPRGVVIFDDYGALDGAKKAVDEFAAQRHLGWFLNRIDPHVRLVIK